MKSFKDVFLKNLIMEFLEYCFSNPECAIYPEDFYGKESKIIDDFLKLRNDIEDADEE